MMKLLHKISSLAERCIVALCKTAEARMITLETGCLCTQRHFPSESPAVFAGVRYEVCSVCGVVYLPPGTKPRKEEHSPADNIKEAIDELMNDPTNQAAMGACHEQGIKHKETKADGLAK